MARNPLRAYRPTWVCRLAGHAEARQKAMSADTFRYNEGMGYCARCFLPTSPKLLEDMDEFREILREQQAIADLGSMLKGGKDATSRPST